MPRAQWLQPPRHVLVLFLVVTMAPATALAWLGWQLLKQDRALESQRLQERLDRAADLVAANLERRLTEAVDRLPAPGEPAADAVAVTFLSQKIDTAPSGRLLYYPVVPSPPESPTRVYEAGEALEFRRQDYAGAAAEFRVLARATEPLVRAGALVRLGRVLRKAGRHDEALAVYGTLQQLGSTCVGGVPAELLARQARLAVLEALHQAAEVERTAQGLYADLQQGRWILDRVTYEFYAQEVERRLAADSLPGDSRESALALAEAVDQLWDEWQAVQAGDGSPRGRRSVWVRGRGVLLLWSSLPDRLIALVAGPTYLASEWGGAWRGLGVSVALTDAAAHTVLGNAAAPGEPQAVRTMADTRLPWTMRVVSADPVADLAQLAARRRLLLAGLGLMGMVVLIGGYFTGRAVTKELAVARLQSDFVSAVSHEFRTPLTSMRHLTELLDRNVVTDEGRRKQYYAALAHETTRLHRLVENLLNFGRMEAGALEYRLEPVPIAALVEGVVADFRQEVAAGGHCIELRVDDSLPTVRADHEALARAVWNLLDNAMKYSPPDTTVRVDVEREDHKVAIRVRDEGPGIPPGEQKQIFKKFVRGAVARGSSVKGTGIGLATVQHIVRAHHGEVRVESQPGKGSTFTILLPLAQRGPGNGGQEPG
jgi:signal transduction histidine kinase